MAVALPKELYSLLRCPYDHGLLTRNMGGDALTCQSCAVSFSVRDGVPLLINTTNSLFSADHLILDHNPAETSSRLKNLVRGVMPQIGLNVAAEQNYEHFRDLLLRQAGHPVVLIIGSPSPVHRTAT